MKTMLSLSINKLLFASPQHGIDAFNVLRGEMHNSTQPYGEINLCDYTGDDLAHVVKSRLALCNRLHITLDKLIMPRQTHSVNVAVVDDQLMALPYDQMTNRLQNVDALVTPLSGVCIGVNTADCVNIVLCDREADIVAVAHAGWRGTANRIALNTVTAMQMLGARPSRIVATMGASICRQCFEVGNEVVEEFAAQHFNLNAMITRNADTGKAHINLQQANAQVLAEAGLDTQNICWNGECSRCNPHAYFSARRLGINSGRTFTGIIRYDMQHLT